MKIYNKTIAILGIIFIFLFLLTAAVTNYVFMTHTKQIENDVLQDNALRVQRAFANEINHLNRTTYDWAAWDDTYNYIQGQNPEYINSNFDSIETLITLNINFMLFYDAEGNLVYGRACDLKNEEETSLPAEFLEQVDRNELLITHTSASSVYSGVVKLSDSCTIITSRPIIKSNYEGPIVGTLIIGRTLDKSFIEPMEEQTLLPIDFQLIDNPDMPSDFASKKEQVLEDKYITTIDAENEIVSAYFLMEDVYGNPCLIMKTNMPRGIYNEGVSAISITFYMSLIISFYFALILLFLLKKNLISRITSLRNGIQEINLKGDLNSRLEIYGKDELTELADNINSMLDSLQENNSIFQSTSESIAYGLIAIDNENNILYENPEFIRIFGLDPELENEKNSLKILDAAASKCKNADEIYRIAESRKTSTEKHKTYWELKNGRTIEAYSTPLSNKDGVFGRLYTFNDITEIQLREKKLRQEIARREEAEQKLVLSEEKFSKIATSANDAIIMINSQGETIFWNDAATEIFGYSEKEVLGKNIHTLISPEKYTEAYNKSFRTFAETGLGPVIGTTIELEGKKKDGTKFPIELSLSSMQLSDGSWNAAAIIRDISERKRLDEIEHEILERLTTIINNINSGIVLIDSETRTIVDVNPVAAKLIGLPKDKIIGKTCHNFLCPYEIGHCPIIDLNQKVNKSERILLDKDGNEIPIIKSVVTVKLKEKEYLVESFYDISNIKRVEEALITAKLAAEASDKAKSEFLANISHELRTPLNSIIGFSEMLLYNEHDKYSKRWARYLTNISNSGKHLLEVINDILDLSKIEAGRMDLTAQEFNVPDAMDEVSKIVSPLAMKKGLHLEFNIDDDISTILADRLKFKQILYNIIGNAIKFTPDEGYVQIFARKVLNNIEIEVKDTGIGIHPDDLKTLFEPFRQIDSALSRNYQGTGLGLAIVKKYVEMHNGNIRAESEPGKGSSFIFELPINQ